MFWLGLVAILFFSHELGIFPALGASSEAGLLVSLHHLALPAIVLGLSVAAYIARLTRSAMLEVLGQDHIRVARAMGVPERRIVWHLALRNALIPILAVIGVTFAWSLGNAILIETVFSRPGRRLDHPQGHPRARLPAGAGGRAGAGGGCRAAQHDARPPLRR